MAHCSEYSTHTSAASHVQEYMDKMHAERKRKEARLEREFFLQSLHQSAHVAIPDSPKKSARVLRTSSAENKACVASQRSSTCAMARSHSLDDLDEAAWRTQPVTSPVRAKKSTNLAVVLRTSSAEKKACVASQRRTKCAMPRSHALDDLDEAEFRTQSVTSPVPDRTKSIAKVLRTSSASSTSTSSTSWARNAGLVRAMGKSRREAGQGLEQIRPHSSSALPLLSARFSNPRSPASKARSLRMLPLAGSFFENPRTLKNPGLETFVDKQRDIDVEGSLQMRTMEWVQSEAGVNADVCVGEVV